MSSAEFDVELADAQLPLVLALDVGSSASRGALYDATGRPVNSRKKVAHSFTTHTDGTSTLDPDQVVEEIADIIEQLVELAGDSPIAAVAIDTFASSLVGIDPDGIPTTTCITYNDNRCEDYVHTLREEADEAAFQQTTGCRFHASYLPARLRWLKEEHPVTFKKTSTWVSLGEYIHLALLGRAKAGTSTASWSGLLNRHTTDWDPEVLELSGITTDHLLEVGHPEDHYRPRRSSRAYYQWPQLREAAWLPPVADGYSAARGIGEGVDSLVISLSTSGAMRILIEDPKEMDLPPGLWLYRVDEKHSLLGGAVNDVGRAVSWATRELQLPDADVVQSHLFEPPSHVTPLVLPFFTGERSVGWRGDARATMHNVDFSTSALELYRGVLEGAVWTLQRIYDQMAQIKPGITTARVGGRIASEAPGILTVLADGLTLEVVPITIKRSTLLGTARIALDVVAPDVQRTEVPSVDQLRPDRVRARFYDSRQHQLDTLYKSLYGAPDGEL